MLEWIPLVDNEYTLELNPTQSIITTTNPYEKQSGLEARREPESCFKPYLDIDLMKPFQGLGDFSYSDVVTRSLENKM